MGLLRRSVASLPHCPQAFQQKVGTAATAEQPALEQAQQQPAAPVQQDGGVQVLPQLWGVLADRFGDRIAVHDPHQRTETKLTYRCF